LSKQDQYGNWYKFDGALGVAPQWKSGACDSSCQQIVSACLMAHVNTSGRHIKLWLASPVPAIGFGRSAAAPLQESAFFGNVFVSPPQAYFCNGVDWERGPAEGRIGASQTGAPYTNPFGTNALCASRCAKAGFWNEAYSGCSGYGNNVVTVFRDLDSGSQYTMQNTSDSLYMDVRSMSTSAGAPLIQYGATGQLNQRFYFERVSVKSDSGTYRIRAANSNLYLTLENGSTADGTRVVQQPWTGASSQIFDMTQMSGGTYLIVHDASTKVLMPAGASSASAAGIALAPFTTNAPNLWKLSWVAD